MPRVPNTLRTTAFIILPEENGAGEATARGHLFEVFFARLLESFGYLTPTRRNVNVKSEGIELDVSTETRLDQRPAIAECKAYERNVPAHELTNFYGKLTVERFTAPDTLGVFVALPGLTSDGEEKASAIRAQDGRFRYLSSVDVVASLESEGIVTAPPTEVNRRLLSDDAIVITTEGTFRAGIRVSSSGQPEDVAVWHADSPVPERTLQLVATSVYAQGLPVVDVRQPRAPAQGAVDPGPDVLATVKSASEDFQYQLPASPKLFLGRRDMLRELQLQVDGGTRSFVFNAQSGWGKSSLALKFADMFDRAWVMDTRTATGPRYVVDVLKKVTNELATAEPTIGASASWASLDSALETIRQSSLPGGRYLIFFDQFENVFRSETTTKAFRDLVLATTDAEIPFTLGFAWKTDLVGWTESHPYQLRDDIRNHSHVAVVEPFGVAEVTTLIARLERRLGARLMPDLRSRLREYGQGLPWLLKKLSEHTARELAKGVSQEALLAEALNVQSLFEADLAELNPQQIELLKHVARYAPIPASEVTERYPHEAVQSLVDRRLLVQIGDRLDTYWDTFRDYLNTGRVPVEDSYILRQMPNSVGRLLRAVLKRGGSASTAELSAELATSANVIFNLSRELRLLGITNYEPLKVVITAPILNATDREEAVRAAIARALRRHRAFSIAKGLQERTGGPFTAELLARSIPAAFPAVSATSGTWLIYARAFLAWFEYCGLATREANVWRVRPDGDSPLTQRLLAARSALRSRPGVPQESSRVPLALLRRIGGDDPVMLPAKGTPERDAARALANLGAISADASGQMTLAIPALIVAGEVSQPELLRLLRAAPGGGAGIALLETNPAASARDVGYAIRDTIGANWTEASTLSVGGYFRAWARDAGMPIQRAPRRTRGTAKP